MHHLKLSRAAGAASLAFLALAANRSLATTYNFSEPFWPTTVFPTPPAQVITPDTPLQITNSTNGIDRIGAGTGPFTTLGSFIGTTALFGVTSLPTNPASPAVSFSYTIPQATTAFGVTLLTQSSSFFSSLGESLVVRATDTVAGSVSKTIPLLDAAPAHAESVDFASLFGAPLTHITGFSIGLQSGTSTSSAQFAITALTLSPIGGSTPPPSFLTTTPGSGSTLDFGQVRIGTSSTKSVSASTTTTNNGAVVPISFSGFIGGPNPNSIFTGPGALLQPASTTSTVSTSYSFAPPPVPNQFSNAPVNTFAGSISVSDGLNTSTISLKGISEGPARTVTLPSPAERTPMTTARGAFRDFDLALGNNDGASSLDPLALTGLTVGSLSIQATETKADGSTADVSSDFQVQGIALGTVIAPSFTATTSFKVRFRPSTATTGHITFNVILADDQNRAFGTTTDVNTIASLTADAPLLVPAVLPTTPLSINGGSTVVGGITAALNSPTGGEFSATYSTDPAGIPGNPNFLVPAVLPQYWDIEFTGQHTGPITLTFNYDPSLFPANFDFSILTVNHLLSTGNYEMLVPAVDVAHHTLTVTTNSLSPFVLGIPEPTALFLLAVAPILSTRRRHPRR